VLLTVLVGYKDGLKLREGSKHQEIVNVKKCVEIKPVISEPKNISKAVDVDEFMVKLKKFVGFLKFIEDINAVKSVGAVRNAEIQVYKHGKRVTLNNVFLVDIVFKESETAMFYAMSESGRVYCGENLIHADPLVLNNMVTNKKHIENFKSKLTNLKEQLEEVQSNYFILLTDKLCLKQGSYKVAEQFTNN
jgi:hypothetical protein